MATNWNDFEPADPDTPRAVTKPGKTDWSQFTPVKADDSSDLGRGFKESFQQLPQLGYGLLAGAGAAGEAVFGEGGISTGVKKAGVAGYQDWGNKIAAGSKESDSWDYSFDQAKQGNFGALVDWLQHGIGYVGGQGAQMLATAGIGAVGGKIVAATAAKQIAERMVAKSAAELASTEAGATLTAAELTQAATARVADKFASIGQNAAVGAMGFGQEGGEIFGDLSKQSVDEGRSLTGSELGKAFISSLAAGSLEFVGDKIGLDVILGKSKLLKPAESVAGIKGRLARGGIAAAAETPIEAGTEYLQTGLENYGKGKEANVLPFNQSEAAQKDARESAMLGALGGTVIGGAGGALHGAKAAEVAPAPVEAPAPPLAIGNTPDPYISFPDGTVGKRADVDRYVASLPEDQQHDARAALLGINPQRNAIEKIGASQTVDEAIAAATEAVSQPLELPDVDESALSPFMRRAPGATQERDIAGITLDAEMAKQLAQREADLDAIGSTAPEARAEFDAQQAARQRAATVEAPSAMELALRRAAPVEAAAPAPAAPAEPRIVARTPDMQPTSQAKAQAQADATGGEVVRVQNQSGKFAYVALPAAQKEIQPGDLMTGDGQPYGSNIAAKVRARKDGGTVVAVTGGWVVRPQQTEPAPSAGERWSVDQEANIRSDLSGMDAGDRESIALILERKLEKKGKLTPQDIPDALHGIGSLGYSTIYNNIGSSPAEVIRAIRGDQPATETATDERQPVPASPGPADGDRSGLADDAGSVAADGRLDAVPEPSVPSGDAPAAGQAGDAGLASGEDDAAVAAPQAFKTDLKKDGSVTVLGDPAAIKAALPGITGIAGKRGVSYGKAKAGAVMKALKAAQQKPKAKRRVTVDPERDTLLQAVAKMGGINRDELAREFGMKPEELKSTVPVGNLKGFPFRKAGGLSIDGALEQLREAGYFDGVADDATRSQLEEAIFGELGGSPRLSTRGQMRQAEERGAEDAAEQQARAEAEEFTEADREELDALSSTSEGLQYLPRLDDDDLPGLDAPGETDPAAIMRALGFTEEEINDELAIEAAGQGREAEAGPRAGEDAGGETSADGRTGSEAPRGAAAEELTLTSPTSEDLSEGAERARQTAADDAAEQKRLAGKAKADAERGEFTLTGSDSPADVAAAAGQGGLFDAPATQAADILTAAGVTGKERIDALKDVKAGTITTDELKDAYPAKEAPAAEPEAMQPEQPSNAAAPEELSHTEPVVREDTPAAYGDPTAAESSQVEAGLTGKTLLQAADWLAENAPPELGLIAQAARKQLARLQLAGAKFTFKIAHLGDQVPRMLMGARGITSYEFGEKSGKGQIDIWLNGADVQGKVGVSFETATHEIVHAATMAAVRLGNLRSQAGTPLAQHVSDLYAVTNFVRAEFNKRVDEARAGTRILTDFEERMYQRANNAFADANETITWALTDKDAQTFLESIQYKGKSAWTSFVQIIRSMLGLSAKSDTALSEVLRISEELLSDETHTLTEGMQNRDGTDTVMQRGMFDQTLPQDSIEQAHQSTAPTSRDRIADKLRNAGGGPKIIGNTGRAYTPAQLAAMRAVGFQVTAPTLEERAKAIWKDAGKKLAQGLVDQFAPIKEISADAYSLLRLAKGASGAFEAMLQGGKLKLSDGVYDFDETQRGGVVDTLLKPLGGEHHDFFRWVAANRAERLKAEGKENLFTPDDIKALKTLADGRAGFDYELQHGANAGTKTRDRSLIYADALKTFNGFNKNVLDLAEQSGLIDGESRKLWEHEFYVPFYRVAEEEGGSVAGMNIKGGSVRQQAFKQLKGGKQALNADLMDNTLMNWAHLLDASAKNRAAVATLAAAENMGVAITAPEATAREMANSIGQKSNVVWVMDGGQKHFYVVEDPYVMTALTSLEYAGMRSPIMKALGSFKHALTLGVTASPFFKVRNLIRDSVQAIAAAPLSYNVAGNLKQGWALTDPKSDAYFRLLAGGGTIHFGTMMEGSEAKRVQALVESGVDAGTVLNSDKKLKAFYRKFIEPSITAYNELGNRGEAITRAALYAQLTKQGMSHRQASLQARDLMDFSMQGSFTSVRFLTQVVPFFNARLQGLYKLGRAAKEDPARISTVIGAAALAGLGLMLAYSDDDDWRKREDWDKNGFWWFKFGGTAFRIPKPFEVGAIATLAERGFEYAFDKEMTGKRFRANVLALLGDNLSMNPIPQLAKPLLDVYANKDGFTGRPIETMGMEKLKADYRFTGTTSMTARGISTAANAVTGLVGKETLSPVQVDALLKGYFGWLGSFVVGAGDVIARPLTGQAARPDSDLFKAATGGMLSDLRDAPSRYVSQMYEQATEIERAYTTWKMLVKEGKTEDAAEFFADNQGDITKYRMIEHLKKTVGTLNQQVKRIEQSDESGQTKRERIRALLARKDEVARVL